MEYAEPRPAGRDDLAGALAEGDPAAVRESLAAVVLHDPDWAWVEDQCLTLLDHPDPSVRRVAVTSLGEIARLHGQLNRVPVEARLAALVDDPDIGPSARDALADIQAVLI